MHDQKLIVFAFVAVFVSYCPLFGGSGGFTWPMTLSTCLRGMTKNSPFLRFRAVFMSYCPLFSVFEVIYKAHDTHEMFERYDQKPGHFYVFGPFRELLSTVLGFRGDFQGPWHLVHV
jgi:hypothetical protein